MEYAAFALIAGVLFAADVWLHCRSHHAISIINASVWSLVYVAGALLFAWSLGVTRGSDAASLFLAGYVTEKALSVDNLMVFMAIFAYFRIPAEYQHKVLHYGIIGAVVFRLIFAVVGAGGLVLIGAPVSMLFGIVVLWSAWKMWGGGEAAESVDYANQWYARWAAVVLPFTNDVVGGAFFKRIFHSRVAVFPSRYVLVGTPLLLCVITIEISDVMFSFDSVPAVIAITQDPFLAYSAMIFAILGLRMLYFVLSALTRYLCHLSTAVIGVLVFIGAKLIASSGEAMLLRYAGIDLPVSLEVGAVPSLCVVLGLLIGGVVASLIWPEKETNGSVSG